MSYKNVFYGSIGPLTFNSRAGDILDGNEMGRYLPKDFLIHPFTKLKLGYQLKYHIQVYNDKNVGIGFYLTNSDDYGEDISRNLENCSSQIQIHIDYSTVVGEEGYDFFNRIDDNELTIKWIDTKSHERGKGLAKYLLLLANLYCSLFTKDVVYTKLDDDSDGYANGIENPEERRYKQSKNIYCSVGYKYEDEDGGPEMYAQVTDVLPFIEGYIEKYESKRKELKQDMESIALQSPSKKRRPRGGGYKKNKTKKNKSKRKSKYNKRKKNKTKKKSKRTKRKRY
tara:strand:+ start:3958 stop:4806 length:849 start_codon:yes stop_codon:yes gene_type:complete